MNTNTYTTKVYNAASAAKREGNAIEAHYPLEQMVDDGAAAMLAGRELEDAVAGYITIVEQHQVDPTAHEAAFRRMRDALEGFKGAGRGS